MAEQIFERWCSRCKTTQSLDNFYGSEGKKAGYCKPCAKAYNSEHPTTECETPEARERRRQRDKFHYERNKESRKAYSRARSITNREHIREIQRAYRKSHAEESRVRQQRWNDNHRDELNARSRAKWATRKREAIDAYGGRCYCCGITDIEFLTIDHAHGNGGEARRRLGQKSRFYRWLKQNNYPQDLGLRTACFNCNCAARDKGICPHQMGVLKLAVNA